MIYKIVPDNIFTNVQSPIVIEMGFYNTKMDGYKCITKLLKTDYEVSPLTENNIYKIDSNIVQCAKEDSYSVLCYDKTNESAPQLFSLYIYNPPQIITAEMILQLFNQELPSIYDPNNELNNADNFGAANVFGVIYQELYALFYNALISLGTDKSYNSNWEFVYLGINNFLQNATFPAEFLKTLMRVNTQTSVQIIPMAILVSRLAFQFSGAITPVRVYYDIDDDIYYINIYTSTNAGWQLGIVGRSELGITTVLGSAISSPFLYILSTIIGKLMPVQVKYFINVLSYNDFLANYNTSQVDPLDFIDESVIYDAYSVVNNNNQFNTKGYFLNV